MPHTWRRKSYENDDFKGHSDPNQLVGAEGHLKFLRQSGWKGRTTREPNICFKGEELRSEVMIRCRKTLASVLNFSGDFRTLLANSVKLVKWHSGSLLRHATPETCLDSDVLEDTKWDNLYIVDDNNLLRPSLNSKTGLYVLDLIDSGSIEADRTLYNKLLRRCTQLGKLEQGRLVHSHILGSKFRDDIVIQNSIIYMYARCRNLEDARKVFDKMTSKDMVTWTSLITGYAQNERAEDALMLFSLMLRDGLKPNEFTLSSLVKSSALLPSYRDGRQIHACCIKHGCHSNVYVGSSLVDMYARCGYLDEARQIFDKLVNKNEVSWNALIAGYARKDEGEEALSLFLKMQREGFKPTEFTYSSLFCSCSALGSLEQGKWLHAHMIKWGRKLVGFVGNTLLHMYAKAGNIEDAKKVFTRLIKVDLVSWNSMLIGYAQHGLGKEAVQEFEEMIRVGFEPNDISFLCVLTACSRAGLLNDGKYYFKLMNKYKVEPKVSHYVTMVDLLGRAGFLDEAKKFIEEEMPIEPPAAIWGALLGASKTHKNLEMGAYAAERIFELDPSDSGPHILLANMYASAGRWSEAARIRKLMRESGVKKEPACSWVELGNSVHVFVADDDAHPQKEKIHKMWEELSQKIKEIGYVPDTSHVLLFVDQQEKEAKLQYHSEKLALSFALLNTYPGSTIRIMKNIRVCGDCHTAIKYVSRVVKREIILRDKNRFHHFRDGSCSCGDYW